MEDLASRVTTRIQITTDGHRAYAEAVEGAFGMNVDYAMLEAGLTDHGWTVSELVTMQEHATKRAAA